MSSRPPTRCWCACRVAPLGASTGRRSVGFGEAGAHYPTGPRRRPASRAAAELAVYVALVNKANGCSDECGGTVLRRLPTVPWESDPSDCKAGGTLGEVLRGLGFDLSDVRFEAIYQRSQGWSSTRWRVDCVRCGFHCSSRRLNGTRGRSHKCSVRRHLPRTVSDQRPCYGCLGFGQGWLFRKLTP